MIQLIDELQRNVMQAIMQASADPEKMIEAGLSALLRQPFMIKDYHEHTLGARSDSRSVAYIRCVFPQGESYWGVGIDNDVARASLQALCNAISVADQVEGRK